MRTAPLVLALLAATGLVSSGCEACNGPRTSDELRRALWFGNQEYGKHTRPGLALVAANFSSEVPQAPPDEVEIRMKLYSLPEVDTASETFSVVLYTIVEWQDLRLRFNDVKAGGCILENPVQFASPALDEIWTPGVVGRPPAAWTFNNLVCSQGRVVPRAVPHATF